MCELSAQSALSLGRDRRFSRPKIRAISAIRGYVSMLVFLLRGCRTVQSPYKPPPGNVFLKKSAQKAQKAIKVPSLTLKLAGFPSITEALLRNLARGEGCLTPETHLRRTNGTICLPSRLTLAMVPFVIRRLLSPGLCWPGLSGVWVFPKLSKLLNQEDAWASPGYALNPARRTRGPLPCCGQA
jgi:hypothetical protein